MEMDEKEAIEYLEEHGEIREITSEEKHPKWTKTEERLINETMKTNAREAAIEELQEEGDIRQDVIDIKQPKYNQEEKAKIEQVMKEGKIYDRKTKGRVFGDPSAEVHF